MVEDRLKEARLKLREANQQVGELMINNGISDAPIAATKFFHVGSMFEDNIQKWENGVAIAGDEEIDQSGTTNSELEQSVADPDKLLPTSGPTLNATADGNLPLHKDGNLQDVTKNLEEVYTTQGGEVFFKSLAGGSRRKYVLSCCPGLLLAATSSSYSIKKGESPIKFWNRDGTYECDQELPGSRKPGMLSVLEGAALPFWPMIYNIFEFKKKSYRGSSSKASSQTSSLAGIPEHTSSAASGSSKVAANGSPIPRSRTQPSKNQSAPKSRTKNLKPGSTTLEPTSVGSVVNRSSIISDRKESYSI